MLPGETLPARVYEHVGRAGETLRSISMLYTGGTHGWRALALENQIASVYGGKNIVGKTLRLPEGWAEKLMQEAVEL